jgi:membrane-associated phospholipid phosphatase
MVRTHLLAGRVSVAVLIMVLGSVSVRAADRIETAGSVLDIVLPATAAVVTIAHRDGVGAGQLAVSLGVTVGVTWALKHMINETRPNGGGLSFPSGHTSVSFSSAEFMRRRYGWMYGAPVYALAAFVGYSRVESHQHYVHDVIAGAGIGIASSYVFTKPYKKWTASGKGDTRSFSINVARTW